MQTNSIQIVTGVKVIIDAWQPSSSCSQVVLVYLHPFRRNSLLKCCSHKLQKKH